MIGLDVGPSCLLPCGTEMILSGETLLLAMELCWPLKSPTFSSQHFGGAEGVLPLAQLRFAPDPGMS